MDSSHPTSVAMSERLYTNSPPHISYRCVFSSFSTHFLPAQVSTVTRYNLFVFLSILYLEISYGIDIS